MPIEIDVIYTQEDYDNAVLMPSRPFRILSFLIGLAIAIVFLTLIGYGAFDTLKTLITNAASGPMLEPLLILERLRWAIPVLVALLVFVAAYFFWVICAQLYAWRMARKPRDVRRLQDGVHLGPMKLVLTEAGLISRARDERSHFAWKAFAEVVEEPTHLRLRFALSNGKVWVSSLFIPTSAFPSDIERIKALDYARARILDARGRA